MNCFKNYFEDIGSLYLIDLVGACNDKYSMDEMLAMEMKILTALNFDISVTVASLYLRGYARVMNFKANQVSKSL